MKPELPSQRNCLACLRLQTFGMLKQGQVTFGLGQNHIMSPRTVCRHKRKQILWLLDWSITMLAFSAPFINVILPFSFLINTPCLCLQIGTLFEFLPESVILKKAIFFNISQINACCLSLRKTFDFYGNSFNDVVWSLLVHFTHSSPLFYVLFHAFCLQF